MGIVQSYKEVMGPRFFLSVSSPGSVTSTLATDIIPYITHFEFEDGDGTHAAHTHSHHTGGFIDNMKIVVANPGLKWRDDPRFQEGARYSVRYGYLGDISDIKSAVISKAKPHFGKGMPTIEMIAYNLQQDMNKDQNAFNYGPGITSDAVAQIIAKRYNFQTDIEPSNDARAQHRVQPASMTDLQYLITLASPLNWDCYLDGVTLHFHHKRYEQPSGLTFTYFTDNTGTLLEFRPDINLNQPPNAGVAGASNKTGDSSAASRPSGPGRQINFDNKTVGALIPGRSNGPVANTGQGGILNHSAESDPRVIALHGVARGQKIDMRAVKATAEIVGTPRCRARTMISIAGVDQQYSGNWRVTKSKHVIEPRGVYRTSLHLSRDAGMSKSATENKKNGTNNAGGNGPPQRIVNVNNKTTQPKMSP